MRMHDMPQGLTAWSLALCGRCPRTRRALPARGPAAQGAFILVGSSSIGDGLLVVMGICIAFYVAWRFWEGITGQGTDAANSKGLNFFRYRLSPIVSGFVCAPAAGA